MGRHLARNRLAGSPVGLNPPDLTAMCGIYGIVSLDDQFSPDPGALTCMARVLHHRGPDDEGAYADDRVALGMRRLSIIDLDSGHQPIANEDETVHVVCNGEIFNYRELTARLTALGHRFRTGSDTEVIVHLYEEYGLSCVEHLTGMYGFALWDSREQRLVLGRDRLGIKPLYFLRDRERLVFASEAKAILALPGVTAELDPAALQEYLTLGYTPGHASMFRGIEKLPPASLLVCERGGIRVSQYWQVPEEVDTGRGEAAWAAETAERIREAVRLEMVSDVPLGAFLSGGLDSSTVVANMARFSSQPVKTYSIGFDTGPAGRYYNELPYARQVSEAFGTDHKEILVRPDVAALLPKLLWHMDEPIADSAFVTTYLVAQFARRDVTVILSGVGGDELFGGYRRYLGDFYARRYNRLPAWLRRSVVAPLTRHLPVDRHNPMTNLMRYARSFVATSDLPPEERYRSYVQLFGEDSLARLLKGARGGTVDSLETAFQAAVGGDTLNRLMRVDLMTQLPNDLLMLTDKMTMAASIECRVPLLNHELVELGAGLPAGLRIRGGDLKHVLKRAMKEDLPAAVLTRKKRGFGAPMGAWLKKELMPVMTRLLSRQAIERRGLFDWKVVSEIIALHEARREDHTDHLLALLNFEIWARIFLDGRSPEDLSDELAAEVVS